MIIEVKKDPRYKVSIKAIKVIAEKVLIEFGLDDKTELSIIFVGKRKAKNIAPKNATDITEDKNGRSGER